MTTLKIARPMVKFYDKRYPLLYQINPFICLQCLSSTCLQDDKIQNEDFITCIFPTALNVMLHHLLTNSINKFEIPYE